MNEKTSALLRRFEATTIRSVSLLSDEVAFALSDDGHLTCVRLPAILRGGVALPARSGKWFRALWDCVGQQPADASVTEGTFAFTAGESRIEVDLRAPDHPSPESVILRLQDAWEVF